jgi:hypothetical protein
MTKNYSTVKKIALHVKDWIIICTGDVNKVDTKTDPITTKPPDIT